MKMKKQLKKLVALILVFSMLLFNVSTTLIQSKGKVALSKKSITLTLNQTTILKLKNNSKKVSWKVIKGKKNVKLSKKTKKSVKIQAIKVGSSTIQAKIGKKKTKHQLLPHRSLLQQR